MLSAGNVHYPVWHSMSSSLQLSAFLFHRHRLFSKPLRTFTIKEKTLLVKHQSETHTVFLAALIHEMLLALTEKHTLRSYQVYSRYIWKCKLNGEKTDGIKIEDIKGEIGHITKKNIKAIRRCTLERLWHWQPGQAKLPNLIIEEECSKNKKQTSNSESN